MTGILVSMLKLEMALPNAPVRSVAEKTAVVARHENLLWLLEGGVTVPVMTLL